MNLRSYFSVFCVCIYVCVCVCVCVCVFVIRHWRIVNVVGVIVFCRHGWSLQRGFSLSIWVTCSRPRRLWPTYPPVPLSAWIPTSPGRLCRCVTLWPARPVIKVLFYLLLQWNPLECLDRLRNLMQWHKGFFLYQMDKNSNKSWCGQNSRYDTLLLPATSAFFNYFGRFFSVFLLATGGTPAGLALTKRLRSAEPKLSTELFDVLCGAGLLVYTYWFL